MEHVIVHLVAGDAPVRGFRAVFASGGFQVFERADAAAPAR
jgi:hypothetical protein